MSTLRQKLADPKVGGAVVAAILALALYIALTSGGDEGPKFYDKAWYYDLKAGELFPDEGGKKGPFPAPSGGEGVEAVVYGCGSCDELKTGWLIKYSPEALKVLQTDSLSEIVRDGTFVKRPEDKEWVMSNSDEGKAVTNAASEDCGKTRVVTCYPE